MISSPVMRSKLFVPGSRPELFEKAFAAGADAVSFDLEDAVVPERKDEARQAVADFLSSAQKTNRTQIIVRVNAQDSEDYDKDLTAIVESGVDTINLPKVDSPQMLTALAARLTVLEQQQGVGQPIGILANIETPKGVRLAADIAASDPRIMGLQLGFGDLFEPLGIAPENAMNKAVVRLTTRLAAAESGVPVYDGAYAAVADMDGFRAEAIAARAAGLAGKSCIHPSQVATANEVFFPTPSEVERARDIVKAADVRFGEGTGAFVLDGVMIDGPYVDRARAILDLTKEQSIER